MRQNQIIHPLLTHPSPYERWFLYSDGDKPVLFLKQRLKYLGSAKPLS